jgi:GT2 family glycosyltransferase
VSARVTAVVVHWRDAGETLACVASLAAEPGVEVIVVDNGGAAPIAGALAAAAPRARSVASPENLGYAGGANLGIRAALAGGADVVLLLNNDARVHPGATAAARAVLEADPRVAVVGAKVLLREDPRRLWLAWGEVTWRQSLVALRGAGATDGPAFAAERDVDWVAGCAMWLRAGALTSVGLFDETFFAYHEEVDWCARARAAGLRVVYCPRAVVTHTGQGTAGGSAAIRIRKYFAARNAVLYARKHGRPGERLRFAAFLAASLPLELLWHLARGGVGETWLKVRGVRDALAGRRPPLEALGLR